MKTIYLKTKTPVNIGDTIDIDGIKITIDQKFIDNNPSLFEIEEDVPEYWKCIDDNEYSNIWTIGRIYETLPASHESGLPLKGDDGIARTVISYNLPGGSGYVSFKPSTKEAYDKQELLKEAKKRYSIGTKIKNAFYPKANKNIRTVSSEPFFKNNELRVGVYETRVEMSLYFNDKWAEIIKPIFTTEDGVDVYEGDKVYWVTKNLFQNNTMWGSCNSVCSRNKYFSSKQAAQEYVDANKEMRLEDYEHQLLDSDPAIMSKLRFRYKSLFYTKILELIAKDLNGGWKPNFDDQSNNYCIVNNQGHIVVSESKRWYYGNVHFKSKEISKRAIKIMGDKLDYIYKQ